MVGRATLAMLLSSTDMLIVSTIVAMAQYRRGTGRPSGKGVPSGLFGLEPSAGAPIYTARMRLSRRFLLFIGLLGLLHAYIGWRVLPDLGATARAVGGLLLLASYALMLLALVARAIRPRPQADRLAAPGLFMAGFFSSILVLTLLRDLLLLGSILALSAAHVYILKTASANAIAALSV